MATKKKSSGRLSSLLSGFQPNSPLPPSPSPSRLSPNVQPVSSRSSHSREPSEQLLPPAAYPPAGMIQRKPLPHASTDNLTVPQPPAPMRPGHKSQTTTPASSRPASAASSMAGSRPTTPIPQVVAPLQLSPESAKGKPKRKGLLHKDKGAGKHAKPSAWILGSQTPYDMAALVNAQRVRLVRRGDANF